MRRNVRGKRNCKGSMARMSSIAYTLQYLLERFNEDLVPKHWGGGVNIGGRRIKCIRFVDDMDFLATDERMLQNLLIELNGRCEDYGMKININKMKAMIIGRKPKIDIRIKGESIEQVDNFKYLGCNISSNMNCCEEEKQRIEMAKDAFNRKRSIFSGPLETELRKKLVKCFVRSVALYGAET